MPLEIDENDVAAALQGLSFLLGDRSRAITGPTR